MIYTLKLHYVLCTIAFVLPASAQAATNTVDSEAVGQLQRLEALRRDALSGFLHKKLKKGHSMAAAGAHERAIAHFRQALAAIDDTGSFQSERERLHAALATAHFARGKALYNTDAFELAVPHLGDALRFGHPKAEKWLKRAKARHSD